MVITLSGTSAFKIQTGGITLATEETGGGSGRMKPDILLRTSSEKRDLPDAGFTVNGPGEYEIQGVDITGMPPFTYVVGAEDIRLAFISSADVKILDKLNSIDIAFVTNVDGIASFIRQVEPRMVVTPASIGAIVGKELGLAGEAMDKLALKRKDLAAGETKLICLTA